MGDLPTGSGSQPLDIMTAGLAHDEHQGHSNPTPSNVKSPSSNTPFYSQLSSIPQGQFHPDLRSPAHPTSPPYPAQEQSSLNMGAMAGALPEYAPIDAVQGNPQAPPQHGQRQLSGASTSALVYQLQQNLQIPGPASASLPTHSPYGPGFGAGQYPQNFVPAQSSQHTNYAAFPTNQQRLAGPGSMQTPYQNFAQPSQYLYYPSPYGPQAQFQQAFPGQGAQGQAMFGRRQSLPSAHAPLAGHDVGMSQQEGGRMAPGGQGEPGTIGSIFGGPFMQAQGEWVCLER